ncbi:hypothetical protein CYLTODRAFT_441049 [Cylindrobasidium torrendii FP15055 ss-10]|uniref:Glycerophosphocholine acyltransferase 1 n=1 Tax=Cylindrobasidium torrendii FP15055 ss-10 TaxID=1314674 RepID=A0A0D7BMN3_9AGAR|nr:hypothetical protein CYLTODRAFT_441049 [Cylindrobasidium torrendii FP15055 ss-10]
MSRKDSPKSPIKDFKYMRRIQSVRDDMSDWSGGFTLLDTFETFFDSHVDLLQRKLQKHSDRLKLKAEERFKLPELKGDALAENLDREIKNFKLKVRKVSPATCVSANPRIPQISTRVTKLSEEWQSAKVIRTREKISFFFGVMSVLFTALLFGMAPEWIHIAYTVLGIYLLPLRAYTYKKRAYHYFLFDLCYFTTILNFVYLWILPGNVPLFVACYCLSNGSLANAVITWRNSLVFHDQDKVTSLFVHIYAPLTFTVIRHFYPNASDRFPALKELPHMHPGKALLLSGGIYVAWQLMYWKFLLVDRREKIMSGQRTTSFSWMLNDKRGAIGRTLSSIPEQYRSITFMFGQFLYTLLTELPAVFVLYDSARWSAAYIIFIFSVSVWNGGGYYIEVFGRKFERELEAMRKELAEATASRSGRTSPSDDDSGLSDSSSPRLESRELLAEVATESSADLLDAALHDGKLKQQ